MDRTAKALIIYSGNGDSNDNVQMYSLIRVGLTAVPAVGFVEGLNAKRRGASQASRHDRTTGAQPLSTNPERFSQVERWIIIYLNNNKNYIIILIIR